MPFSVRPPSISPIRCLTLRRSQSFISFREIGQKANAVTYTFDSCFFMTVVCASTCLRGVVLYNEPFELCAFSQFL